MTDREAALQALEERKANAPKRKRNEDLYAGSPMYFYCTVCGHQSDVVPETYTPSPGYPRKICDFCANLRAQGFID